jgi:hypothetical protein
VVEFLQTATTRLALFGSEAASFLTRAAITASLAGAGVPAQAPPMIMYFAPVRAALATVIIA